MTLVIGVMPWSIDFLSFAVVDVMSCRRNDDFWDRETQWSLGGLSCKECESEAELLRCLNLGLWLAEFVRLLIAGFVVPEDGVGLG